MLCVQFRREGSSVSLVGGVAAVGGLLLTGACSGGPWAWRPGSCPCGGWLRLPSRQGLSSGSPHAWRGGQEHWESSPMATLSGDAAGEILN